MRYSMPRWLFRQVLPIICLIGLIPSVSNAQVSISCPADIVVNTDPSVCEAVVTYMTPVGTGSGTNINTTLTGGLASGSIFPIGTTVVEYTVTNDEGDSDVCSFNVLVEDNEDPVFDCPPDIIVTEDPGTCEAIVVFSDPTADDNCGVDAITQIGGLPSGSTFPVGETNIDYQASDQAGNLAFCRFKVIVEDISDPTITCPSDIIVDVFNSCDSVINYVPPVGVDACGPSLTTQTGGLGSGSSFPVGTTVETYTVTDLAGNTASCSFNITLVDAAPPEITCPGDVSAVADPNTCDATVTFADATATDNCSVAGVAQTQGLPSGSSFEVGVHTIEYTALDDTGNSSTCTFTVTVTENEDPMITCPADITVDADAGDCGAIVGYTAPDGTDNCDGASTSLTNGLGAGSFFPVGVTTEEYTVTDASGNTASCSFTVTVNDSEDPTISCPTDIAVDVDPGTCEAIVNFVTPTGDDNCPGVMVTQTDGPVSGSAFPIGNTVIEFTAEDAAGNTSVCTFNIDVTDNEAPQITCPADQTFDLLGGECEGVVTYPAPTITDNCPGATFTVVSGPTSGDVVAAGVYTVELQAIDAAGNTADCSFQLTVTENSEPVFDCPSDITIANDAGACEAVVNFPDPTAADSCSAVTVTQTGGPVSGSTFPLGSTAIEYTAEDAFGNTSTCTFNIIVEDQEDPTITCPADIAVDVDPGTCEAIVNFVAPTGDDNCPGVVVTQTDGPISGSAFPIGNTVIEFTAEDAAGNTAVCTFNIDVTDNEAPQITCPADQTFDLLGGECEGVVTYPDPTITDNCPGVTLNVVSGPASGDVVAAGVYTVELQAIDAAGNMANCSFQLTVTENSEPVIDCPSDITVANDAGVCEAVVNFPDPTAADSCSAVTVTQTGGPVSGSTFPLGSTAIEYTAEDAFGNTSTCTFNIIVEDQEDPTITCPADIAVDVDPGTCEAIVNFVAPTGDDNCPGVVVTQTDGPISGSAFPIGNTVIEFTAEDAAGNTAVCTFNIDVTDNEAPHITCPADQTFDLLGGECEGVVTYPDPTITDNCPGATFNVVSGPASGDVVAAGVYTVELQAIDAAGNTADCSFQLTVTENSDPVFDCPDDIEVPADPGSCEAIVNFVPPTAVDSCSSVTVTQIGGPLSGATFPAGPTTLEFIAEDEFGNTSTCSYVVTVVDDTDPTITCESDIEVSVDAGTCGAVVNYNAPVVDDNCGIASIDQTEGLGSGSTFPVGTTTETYVVTDVSGNTDTCSFDITVNDDELPTITCDSDINIVLPDGDCEGIVNYALPIVNDNCGIASTTLIDGIESGELFPVGATTVTYETVDLSGNSAQCSFTVTLTENVAPTINCPSDITVSNDPGQCAAVVTYIPPVGLDNCPGAQTNLTSGLGSGATFPVGTTTEEYTVTDASGNTATCSFTVTVTDGEDPVINCPADITVPNDAGLCEAVVNYSIPTVTDNCTAGIVPVLISGQASGTAFTVGTHTITFEATDVAGNASQCSFTITVEDQEDPMITCPADLVVDAVSGDCSTVVNYADPVATDNCTIVTLTLIDGLASGSDFPVGVNTVTYEATDDAGNSVECSFTITVMEDVPPTITCPADIVVSNDLNECSAIVNYTAPVGDDNCGGAVTELIAGLASGSEFPVGSTTVTYEVTDISGNTAQCSFTVTVQDDELPVFDCPGTIEISADSNCEATYTFDMPMATDNCSIGLAVIQTEGPASGTTLGLGSTTFTFETTDDAGNTAQCSYNVTVVDDESPVFTVCPSDATIPVNDGACTTVVTFDTPVATDNCFVTLTQTSGPS